ncbi:MAG TPA: 30S ribosomal protein S21 [Pyrinomonadaceae bacterium]|jgi:small subunit ribosomal protein S21
MALVNLNPGESIESALRRFKRKVMTEEIIKDLKKHQHFIPPGQKAKLKSANARKRNRRKGRPRMMNNQQGGFNNQQGGFNQQGNQQGNFQRPQGGFNRE